MVEVVKRKELVRARRVSNLERRKICQRESAVFEGKDERD